MPEKRLGILVGGGPAPGINSAISAVTIEARHEGCEVIGIEDGFEHLIHGRTDAVRHLDISDVSRIHTQGGSILRTSRANPTTTPAHMQRTVEALRALRLDYLVSIGGEDTAFSASEVARASGGALRVAHVPKTIDNDLPLPGGMPTFGYETARHVGTELVLTLMEDSRTTNRWFIVVVMGRKAGHLALGIGKAAGATLTLIPEEFPGERIELDDIARVIAGAVIKRRAFGRKDGLVVLAEGLAEKLDVQELARTSGIEIAYDPHGHIALNDIPLAALLKRRVQRWFAERGESMTMVDVTLGYELRCARPIPFDIDYTRTLGYGAVRFLLNEHDDPRLREGGFMSLQDGRLQVLPFDDLRDPVTGKTRIRVVDLASEHYQVAREYMVRLEPEDFADPELLARLAASAGMSVEEFRTLFAPAVMGMNGARAAA
ncbi:MAG TPA: diphosphate--fructose-6-phosphate 1-phosphotransferase [Dehalococcoidia bacterium]|jgi:6-phosphofructokinase 1|nr:diphosphate--fructose-6-phosphate 1-phosphotransferase [Dehalococcoidia bacterium]